MTAIVLSGCQPAATPTVNPKAANNGGSDTIVIEGFAFNPASIKVAAGTEVVWVNNDAARHDIKSDTFTSPLLNQGESFRHTFSQAGRYDYYCGVHPSMQGTVIVE